MIYLDTAALVKLVRREPESDALIDWLAVRAEIPLLTSVLAEIELPRALRRTEPHLIAGVPRLMARISRYEIDHVVRATAANYPATDLRSLDAIHLATAHAILGDLLTAFVTYDKRLLASVSALGLPVASPGLTTS